MDTSFVGTKHGHWTVIGVDGRHLLVRCGCGNKSRAQKGDLVNGRTTKCRQCSHAARVGVSNSAVVIHGMADTPTQWVWSDMKRRCLSPHRRGYENYGGRGIKVCKRWMTLANFIADMGARPSPEHQIDRIDNDGNYNKKNCRWVLKRGQNYNKRNTLRFSAFGRVFTMEQATQEFGIPYGTLIQRLTTHKMDPERALTQPVRKAAT